jgi:glycosyltransferase involved in cell wall biosynthesis
MKAVVGVHVHAEPDRLHATLGALERETPGLHVVLLPDGPDAETRAALDRLGDVQRLGTARPRGTAACFNRLASRTDADVLVLLESGALVGPGWLERLLAALTADPATGLAGPSTNRSWNEQGVFPHADAASVVEAAEAVGARFGSLTRPLTPLHSLADFCYAIRRDVIEAVGAADERYGLGPCWEMDYNVRAARAGFRGVWVAGAYVHRAPLTARRARAEEERFDTSRRLYQNSFCALRLRREREGFEPHCRGDDCEHFAPRDLIRLTRPLPGGRRAVSPPPPLVSCVMPTGNRADFALQAVRYFQRQDYPARELIVVDDGADGLENLLPGDPRITYVRVRPGLTIGAKRNRGCELARGDVIAQWDDDDWYSDQRLTVQAGPLLEGRADITALRCDVVLDLERWMFWAPSAGLHRRLFVEDVVGGTLVYRRDVWRSLARYPDRSIAEDAFFLSHAMRRGARLTPIAAGSHFMYVRHGVNTWTFGVGEYLDPAGWMRAAEPALPPADRAYYAARSAEASPALDGRPLVSCVMPTADRRRFVPKAIAYFLRQDYPNRELIVLDDGADAVADLIPSHPAIRYVRLSERMVLGAKRNRACGLARGELIAHWDDDDWQAPHRLSTQVAELERSGADICGSSRVLYFDTSGTRAWVYEYPAHRRRWLAGNGMCYRKELWERAPFPAIRAGEDTRFVWSPAASNAALLDDHRYFAGLVHGGNTSAKATDGPYWRRERIDEVRSLLGQDLEFHLRE